MPQISCERDKYLWIYNESGSKSYGKTDHGYNAHQIVLDLEPGSLLDVGCGKGKFVEWAKGQGIRAVGLDFASGYGIDADILKMPLDDNSFDVVTAFDVLEHLRSEDLVDGLEEMYRVARRFWVLSIGYGPSRIKSPDGFIPLHPISTRDKSWWTPVLSDYGELRYEGQTRKGNSYIICILKKGIRNEKICSCC